MKLNRYLTVAANGLEIVAESRDPLPARYAFDPDSKNQEEAMKSRAELLAELEEKRLENNEIHANLDKFSIADPEAQEGYDPYDNPSLGKVLPDGADIVARRRRILQRKGLL